MSWTITPSTKVPVDPFRSQVSLLLHGDGANGSTTITDSSPTPKTVTAFGNAQISTAQSKFGGSSIYLDGTGDYLRVADSSDFAFGTGDFTIETWAYIADTASSRYFIDTRSGSGNGFPWLLGFIGPSATGYTASWPTNTWVHAACSHSGGTLRVFKDGEIQLIAGSPSLSLTTDLNNSRCYIGSRFSAEGFFNGYIDEFRITKGVARYTANFTPPTAPFPDI